MEHGKPTPQDYSTQVPHSHLHCNLTTVRQEGRKRSSTKPTDRKRLYVHTYTHTKIHVTLKHAHRPALKFTVHTHM